MIDVDCGERPALCVAQVLGTSSEAMVAQRDLSTFMKAPVGCYYVGRAFLIWCKGPSLWGITIWGRPSERDTREACLASEISSHADMRSFACIVDGRRLDGLDPLAYETLTEHFRKRRAHFQRRAQRCAILNPRGLAGAIVIGAQHEAREAGIKIRPFGDIHAALSWLGVPGARAIGRELAAIDARERGGWLGELRCWLASEGSGARLAGAAKHLAMTPRTLQRALARAGSSFRSEVEATRIEAATRRLAESGDKLEAIARELGWSSSQHFQSAFRRATGQTPARWRARAARQTARR